MSMSMSLSALPHDVHEHIGSFLEPNDLLAASLTCRRIETNLRRQLHRHIAINGPRSLLQLIESLLEQDDTDVGPVCFFGNPLPRRGRPQQSVHCPEHVKSRASKVQRLELYEPGPTRNHFATSCHEYDQQLCSLSKLQGHICGGLIGSTIRLLPNLTHLHIYQSSLALTPYLAICIATWNPLLTSFHYHSSHTDATSLAFIISSCPRLTDIDVSGVKSCPCHADNGKRGARELAKAIQSRKNIRRLVFRASRTVSEDGGLVIRSLAHKECSEEGAKLGEEVQVRSRLPMMKRHRCERDAISEDDVDAATSASSHSNLRSLELHRVATPAAAVIDFLKSSASFRLDHLFLGGLSKIKSHHIEEALVDAAKDGQNCFFTANTPLHLELDGNLLSPQLLQSRIGRRLTHLRVYEPTNGGDAIGTAILAGHLPSLQSIVILPPKDDILQWAEEGSLRNRLKQAIAASPNTHLQVRIGDQQWQAVRDEEQRMQTYKEQEEAGLARDSKQQRQWMAIAALGGAAYNGGPIRFDECP